MGRKFYDNKQAERDTTPIKMNWNDYQTRICSGHIGSGRTVRADYNFRTKKATVWLTKEEIKQYEQEKNRTTIRGN